MIFGLSLKKKNATTKNDDEKSIENMEGWVKIYRSILDWEWFGNSKMVHLFVYLLAKANFEDCRWRGIVVKRGQILTSLDTMVIETKLSKQTLRTCIARLKSTQEITHQTTHTYTLITISNYDDYQVAENDSNTEINTEDNTPLTHHQHAINTHNKNIRIKEDKREKENIPPIVPLTEKEKEPSFEEFWDEYHRITSLNKTDREAASKYWHRLSQAEQRRARDNIQPYYASLSDVRWCKKARTYLSDKNFNDEFTLQTNKLGIAL